MINVRTIRKMQDGDTLNLKNGNIKKYKGGFQVNTATVILDTPEKAIEWMKYLTRNFGKSCQIRFKDEKYYVSLTEHTYTRRQAREVAANIFRALFTIGIIWHTRRFNPEIPGVGNPNSWDEYLFIFFNSLSL